MEIRVGYVYANINGDKRRVLAVGNEFAPHNSTTDKSWLAYELLSKEPVNHTGNRKGFSPYRLPIYYSSVRAFSHWATSVVAGYKLDETTLKFMSHEKERLRKDRGLATGIENCWIPAEELTQFTIGAKVWHFKFGDGTIVSLSEGLANFGRNAVIAEIDFGRDKLSQIMLNGLAREEFDLARNAH